MRLSNKKHQVYNSGVLFLGNIKAIYNDSNKKIGEEFIQVEKLFFEDMSRRDEDYEFANSMNCILDRKVKVQRRNINSNQKIKIGNDIYDIYKLDFDFFNTYLYLQRVVTNDR